MGLMTAVTAGASVLGGIAEQKGLERQQEFNDQVNEVNQQAARIRAEQAREQASARAKLLAQKGRRVRGKVVSQVAKSGIQLSGSAMDIVLENQARQTLLFL